MLFDLKKTKVGKTNTEIEVIALSKLSHKNIVKYLDKMWESFDEKLNFSTFMY